MIGAEAVTGESWQVILIGLIAPVFVALIAGAALVLSTRGSRKKLEDVHEQVKTGNGHTLGFGVDELVAGLGRVEGQLDVVKDEVATVRASQEQSKLYQQLHDADDERRFARLFDVNDLPVEEARSTRRMLDAERIEVVPTDPPTGG